MDDHAILTRDLELRFPGGGGVFGVDLQVPTGEVFGFLGPNGAGKTTTIRLLLDLLRPDRGEARLLGREVRTGGSTLRALVGFLPGDLALFPWLTGAETLSLFTGLSGRPPVLRDIVLDTLGFPREALARRVRGYSTGMRQMIGITCAFQHDPELLVLDEPTTGLDPLVREAFLELVRERRRAGRTVFLSSHVLEEIERTADRVGLVVGGRLRLVESVQRLRSERPRRVVRRFRDGRESVTYHGGEPGALLRTLAGEDLVDIEILPATLEEILRETYSDRGGP